MTQVPAIRIYAENRDTFLTLLHRLQALPIDAWQAVHNVTRATADQQHVQTDFLLSTNLGGMKVTLLASGVWSSDYGWDTFVVNELRFRICETEFIGLLSAFAHNTYCILREIELNLQSAERAQRERTQQLGEIHFAENSLRNLLGEFGKFGKSK